MPLENVDHKLSIELEFKSSSPNGILVYAQQNPNADGDFVSISLVNGYYLYSLANQTNSHLKPVVIEGILSSVTTSARGHR